MARATTDVHHHHAFLPAAIIRPGLMISRDVIDREGRVMVPEGTRLEAATIAQIREKGILGVWIRQKHASSHLLDSVRPSSGSTTVLLRPGASSQPADSAVGLPSVGGSAPAAAEPMSIVLADPEPKRRFMVRVVLEAARFRSVDAGNLAQLQEILSHQRIDAVLITSNFPPDGGVAACRALKADPATRSLKIVFCTDNAADPQVAEARAAGADDFLTHPIPIERLMDLLHSHADGSHPPPAEML